MLSDRTGQEERKREAPSLRLTHCMKTILNVINYMLCSWVDPMPSCSSRFFEQRVRRPPYSGMICALVKKQQSLLTLRSHSTANVLVLILDFVPSPPLPSRGAVCGRCAGCSIRCVSSIFMMHVPIGAFTSAIRSNVHTEIQTAEYRTHTRQKFPGSI